MKTAQEIYDECADVVGANAEERMVDIIRQAILDTIEECAKEAEYYVGHGDTPTYIRALKEKVK